MEMAEKGTILFNVEQNRVYAYGVRDADNKHKIPPALKE